MNQPRKIDEWNATDVEIPQGSLAGVFDAQVAQTPDAIALIFGTTEMTYAELDRRATHLAKILRGKGVGPERGVGILLPRRPYLVISILAIVKAGGFYVPLHGKSPDIRLAEMLQLVGTTAVISDQVDRAKSIAPAHCAIFHPQSVSGGNEEDTAGPAHADNHSLAYVMFTSGSTGRPKAVAVTQGNVIKLALDSRWEKGRRVLLNASQSFDPSTHEIWSTLLGGGTIVIPENSISTPEDLKAVCEEHRVDHLWLTAGLFAVFAETNPEAFLAVRDVMAGGDIVSPHAVSRVQSAVPKIKLGNAYGPTECTTFSTYYTIKDGNMGAIPIGSPIDNTRVYVLDDNLSAVQTGKIGELYIAGAGLARGYLGAQSLTAERFIACPEGPKGARMYRTGDLAKWRSDGVLEFLGRADQQVKIRGFRIEPGEVEAALLAQEGVEQCAVIFREDQPGIKRLIAYVVAPGSSEQEVQDTKKALDESLPDYMVPAAIVPIDALPLTLNGKLDRAALPAPVHEAVSETTAGSPQQELLVGIFADVLGVEGVGLEDDFFELGGDSLMATRLVGKIRSATNKDIDVRAVFENPKLAALDDYLKQAKSSVRPSLGPRGVMT